MQNAARALILTFGAAALVACHKQQPQVTNNDEIAIGDNLTSSEIPANAEIETLPPDESSTTSSRELQNGQDNPDVNDVGNGD
jgi:hypothetical protein